MIENVELRYCLNHLDHDGGFGFIDVELNTDFQFLSSIYEVNDIEVQSQ